MRLPCPWDLPLRSSALRTQIRAKKGKNRGPRLITGRSLDARLVWPNPSKTELDSSAYKVCDDVARTNANTQSLGILRAGTRHRFH